MFNQKVNHNLSENPEYVNQSYGAPYVRPVDVHNCGTNILKYTKAHRSDSLPLQKWCSPHVAVESFAMRPIINSKEYFQYIKNYLSKLIINDNDALNQNKMKTERYTLTNNYSVEPSNSFLQAIELNVTNKLIEVMSQASDNISIFKKYNPLCEGLIINDIDIQTYQSMSNSNHFLHSVVFAAVNTTRYNTISFKAKIYQDTSPMINEWDSVIKRVQNSLDVSASAGKNSNSNIYIGFIDLLNNTTCVAGQESDCEFKGYDITNDNYFKSLLNQNQHKDLSWINYPSLVDTTYNGTGDYDQYGNFKISDTGPSNFDNLLKSFLKN